jgi:hypothetical protein
LQATLSSRILTRRRLSVVALITVVAFAGVAVSGQVELADSDQPQLPRAAVTVSADGSLAGVPRSFLGISTEYWSLPLYASRMRAFVRVLSLLRVRSGGPLVLRFGGDSADHAFWDPAHRRLPPWAFGLTPRWLRVASRVIRRLGARVIVDLNLVTTPRGMAARWARAARAGLPPGSIAGFEVGNEPDIYSRANWMAITRNQLTGDRVLPAALTPADYLAAFRADAVALRRAVPGLPLLGPAAANPHAHAGWIAALVGQRFPALGTVSAHRYPYSACVPRRSRAYPTIARLLSPAASSGMAAGLTRAIAIAHRAGLPFRLTELNSVTCSGRPGVSDTFATALWAPAALFSLLRAGVDGVNVHIRADTINSPLVVAARGLTARPLLYGLALFARTLGPHAELVALKLRAARSLHMQAWAVRVAGRYLHVLLINAGRRSVRVSLRLPTVGSATVERLLAHSARARFGITLDGQRLGRSGTWLQRAVRVALPFRRRGYALTVPPRSAALLGARLRAGAFDGARAY